MKLLFEAENWKKFRWFVFFFLYAIIWTFFGYQLCRLHEKPSISRVYVLKGEAKKEHVAKSRYHGLKPEERVLEDSLGQYFIRDGKRCPF